MNLFDLIQQFWSATVAESETIGADERKILEVYFYIGAMVSVGILIDEKYNFECDLAGLEHSLEEMRDKLENSFDPVQYH